MRVPFLKGAAVAACCLWLAACSGESGLRCEDPKFYAGSTSVPPVRVPGDLSVPDESDALQIPSGEPLEVPDAEVPAECLEAPPDFFAEDETEGEN